MQAPYIRLYDTTLREGSQSPLARITPKAKVEVIGILDKLGVDVVEAGFPRAQPEDVEVFKKARELISKTELSGFARAVKGDVDLVAESGADIVQVFIPGSEEQLRAIMGVSRSEALRRLEDSVRHASSRGLRVYVAVTDAPRMGEGELRETVRVSVRAGAEEVVLADTLGIAMPWDVEGLVKIALEEGAPSVGLHLHNDLGLALCNALAGIRAGAREVQVTLGGIGERLGNTPLEELAAIARVKGLYRTGVKYERLIPLVRKALKVLGVNIYPLKPIIGDYAFTHVSDIHVYSTLRHPGSFEGFDPGILGGERALRFGRLSGPRSVKLALETAGLRVSDEEARLIARKLRREYDRVDALDLEGLIEFAKRVLGRSQ